jgi:hypothetical protein
LEFEERIFNVINDQLPERYKKKLTKPRLKSADEGDDASAAA